VARGLSEILAEGIRVFRERDGVDLSDTHIRERASSILALTLHNSRKIPGVASYKGADG